MSVLESDARERVPIRPAGVPGVAWLELRGSILVFRRKSWVATFSAYLPVEWLEREDTRRLDWQRLWKGIIALLIAVLFALPLSVCYVFRILLTPGDALWLVPMAVLCLAMLFAGCALVGAFFSSRPCTTLRMSYAPDALSIRFWREIGEADRQVDTLLGALEFARADLARGAVPNLHVNHGWYQPDPYRMALLKGLVISFFLYVALLAWGLGAFLGALPPFPAWCFGLLAVPPLFHVGIAALLDLPAWSAPRAFRRARRHYRRGALESARTELDAAVETAPDDLSVRILMVRVCAELGALDTALHHCGRISKDRPLIAAALEENLWSIRRLYERMDASATHGE